MVASSPPTSSAAQILRRDSVMCLARQGPILFAYWNAAPTEAALDAVTAALTDMNLQHPGRLGAIMATRAKETPSDSAGEKAKALLRGAGSTLKALAVIQGGTDFMSKMTRISLHAVMGVVRVTGAGPKNAGFFASGREAAQWLVETLGKEGVPTLSNAQLVKTLEWLENEYPPKP